MQAFQMAIIERLEQLIPNVIILRSKRVQAIALECLEETTCMRFWREGFEWGSLMVPYNQGPSAVLYCMNRTLNNLKTFSMIYRNNKYTRYYVSWQYLNKGQFIEMLRERIAVWLPTLNILHSEDTLARTISASIRGRRNIERLASLFAEPPIVVFENNAMNVRGRLFMYTEQNVGFFVANYFLQ